ncbi:MAG: asparagine synthase [Prevotella sp.]|nr:asparagine synthase [Prevotella sp.]
MINKDFCLSSYIAFRYIWKDGMDFAEGMRHSNVEPHPLADRIPVKTAEEIDAEIQTQVDKLYEQYSSIGILLSGGMDSAIVASYLKPGSHAYTFVSKETSIFNNDVERSKEYCKKFDLIQHFIEISFDDFREFTPIVMKQKCSPVHSIEPQIYKAAIEAKKDGVECMLIGDGADYVFGGMDKLLSKDWKFDDFVKRYISLDPEKVLVNPKEITEPFEPYRKNGDMIDFLGFMDDLCTNESYSSYDNAFTSAKMPYHDPYEILIMAEKLDLNRVRNGESKYLIRDLYRMKYPEIPVPEKIPMPRPVDAIFKNWEGPKREEFLKDINMNSLTGNQKWQLWCAEQFLNSLDL